MRYLKNKACYLAGAMQNEVNSGMGWRQFITPKLIEFGVTVYDPTNKVSNSASEIGENKENFRKLILAEKWEELKKVFEPVVRWDLRACDKSDFIIVDYNPRIASIGTTHELCVSSNQRKPILLKYNKEDLQYFNPWIPTLVRPEHLFSSWDLVLHHLQEIDDGKIDPHYWTI